MQFQSHGEDICVEKFLAFIGATFREELSACFYSSRDYIWVAIPGSQPTGQIGKQNKISSTYNI